MTLKQKLLSHVGSFKIYVLCTVTVLLCLNVIEPNIWRDVIIALAAARATVEGIDTWRNPSHSENPEK